MSDLFTHRKHIQSMEHLQKPEIDPNLASNFERLNRGFCEEGGPNGMNLKITRREVFSKEISNVILAARISAPNFYCEKCL